VTATNVRVFGIISEIMIPGNAHAIVIKAMCEAFNACTRINLCPQAMNRDGHLITMAPASEARRFFFSTLHTAIPTSRLLSSSPLPPLTNSRYAR
jgi:hypothetical protein